MHVNSCYGAFMCVMAHILPHVLRYILNHFQCFQWNMHQAKTQRCEFSLMLLYQKVSFNFSQHLLSFETFKRVKCVSLLYGNLEVLYAL